MLPAPLDLTTGRKAPPVVRTFPKLAPLDLSQQTDSRAVSSPRIVMYDPYGCIASASLGGAPDMASAEASAVNNQATEEGCVASASRGGVPDTDSCVNKQVAEEGGLDGLLEELHTSFSEEEWIGQAGRQARDPASDQERFRMEDDFNESPQDGDLASDECESLDFSDVSWDSFMIDSAEIEEAQRVGSSEASPRRPFATLPVVTNRSSDFIPNRSKAHTSPPSSGKAHVKVRNGSMTQYKASKEFSIPKNTLRYRLGENYKNKGRRGPETVLTCDEESQIVCWIKEMQRKAFPVTTGRNKEKRKGKR
ncbi:hypothetical protein quinque_009118 [Culex quinquefasciatus]